VRIERICLFGPSNLEKVESSVKVECIHVKIKRLKLKFRHFVVVTSPFRKSQIS